MDPRLERLRGHQPGAVVTGEQRSDMQAMYIAVFAAEAFPPQDLSDAGIEGITAALGERDPRLAVCARVASEWCGDRDFQRQALFRFLEHLLDDGRGTAADCVLPTGAGKTRIMAALVLIASKLTSSTVPIITPTTEIAEQDFDDVCELARRFDAAIEADGAGLEPYKFRVRWVVTEGQFRRMQRDAATLNDELGALDADDPQRADLKYRAKRLTKLTSATRHTVAVPTARVFDGTQPDVVVYNFHKKVLEEQRRAAAVVPSPFPDSDADSESESEDEDGDVATELEGIPRGAVKVLLVDESHRLGTPTIRESLPKLGWPRVFLLGATPLRVDDAHWVIPREVAYFRPKRWFEVKGYIKTSGLRTFKYKQLRLVMGNEEEEDLYTKEPRENQEQWRSAANYPTGNITLSGAAEVAQRILAADDPKLIRAMSRCRTIVQDGAAIVLRELFLLRSRSGVPHQAMIVVGSVAVGQQLVAWLERQHLAGSMEGRPRVALTASDPAICSADQQRRILAKLANAELDIVVCIRKLIEGYNNNLLAVLAVLCPLSDNYLMQYLGRVVRLIDFRTIQRLQALPPPHRMLHSFFAGWGLAQPPVPASDADLASNQRAIIITCAEMGLNALICGGGMQLTEEVAPSEAPAREVKKTERSEKKQGRSDAQPPTDMDLLGALGCEEEQVGEILDPGAQAAAVTEASLRAEVAAAVQVDNPAALPRLGRALGVRMEEDMAVADASEAAEAPAARLERLRQALSLVLGREATTEEAEAAAAGAGGVRRRGVQEQWAAA